MADRAYLERLTKELSAEGKLIEAGWVGYRLAVMPPNVGRVQLEETQQAFWAGALHLWASINNNLDNDDPDNPTIDEMKRMEGIQAEFEAYAVKIGMNLRTEGNA